MSQIKVYLSYCGWLECPVEWRNMIDYLKTNGNTDKWGDVTIPAIQRELKKSGGQWLDDSETIVFPTEKAYTHWLLRWS